jgi:DNA mismatch endonuclease (patch repair protein)
MRGLSNLRSGRAAFSLDGRPPAPSEEAVADRLTPEARSRNMSRVRSKDTGPELRVRRQLHQAGFRFRLHRSDLPGRPDVVLPRYQIAVFVHGCFWHGHDCKAARRPSSNEAFWNAKIDANMARDALRQEQLREMGWSVVVLWTCSLEEELGALMDRLATL